MQFHLRNALSVKSALVLSALMTSAATSCDNDDDNSGSGNEGGSSTARGGTGAAGRSSTNTGGTGTGGIGAAGSSSKGGGGVATSGGTSAAAGASPTAGAAGLNSGGVAASAGRANAGSAGHAVGGSTGGGAPTAGHAGVAGSWITGGSAGAAGHSSTLTAGQAGQAGAGVTSTFTLLYDTVISTRCLTCHSPGGGGVSVGMLDLSTRANAFANLVGTTGVAAQGTGAGSANVTCASVPNLLRVQPGNAAGSLLWQKVNSKLQGVSAICGNPMPAGSGAALTPAQVDAIAGWINSGAHDD